MSSPLRPCPLNVYSPEGKRLFSGFMPFGSSTVARGDFVYRFEENPETGEQQLVRYRLAQPLE